MTTNKRSIKGIVKEVLILVAVSSLILFVWIGYLLSNHDLEIDAANNKKALSSLTIVSDRETYATARPNGDALTGSSAPARAEFDVRSTVRAAYEEVATNLRKQGYVVSDRFRVAGDSSDMITFLGIEAYTSGAVIEVRLVLDPYYSCSGIKPLCDPSDTKDLISSDLYSTDISKVIIIYDSNIKSNIKYEYGGDGILSK